MNDCLTMYTETYVASRINKEHISCNNFKIRKIVKGNCKTLCIKDFFFCGDVDIFNLSFILNFVKFMFLIEPTKK